MNHVCAECLVEMKCHKNSVTVSRNNNHHWVRSGDMHICPKCGKKVITGFGVAYNSETAAEVVING